MNTLSFSSPESSNSMTALMGALQNACGELLNILGDIAVGIEKISEYGIKSLQWVYAGVKSLFVDAIITSLRKIEIMIAEMKRNWSDLWCSPEYIQSLILLQKSQITNKLGQHTFFRENFARRVNEIFA